MGEYIPTVSRLMEKYLLSTDGTPKEIDEVIDYLKGAGIKEVRYGYDLGPAAASKIAKAGINVLPPDYKI